MMKEFLVASVKLAMSACVLLSLSYCRALCQQIHVPAIDNMPNFPAPYDLRDWKEVALGYDSLVFNANLSGQFLPLVLNNLGSVNYPQDPVFGLYTAVGPTPSTGTAEGINCIPAVISGSLVGIDKTSQFGKNWVQMCEQWFNKANGQNVFMNGFSDETKDDFWYETMPNVFFYELNNLYPHTANFDTEFVSVANQFWNAVTAMGGGTTPWKLPNINHQGFDFVKMVPFDASWKEPEAAGAIAWVLYNAYVVTGNPKYRIGAELSMESLNGFSVDPAYELQLSYGAYTAARMNAELGTNYNVEKIVDWLFTQSSERPWGTIVGTWGGYDASGLVGEIYEAPINNYAFAMNTFEQIGCLVPMVRYDPRFAQAIGKWVLNAANAARLFYPAFLPTANQDSSVNWSSRYDPNSYIAHEAIHQFDPSNQTISPYASGDAITGGWGLTTLALYGSSHVGILGGIIDTTNVQAILKLDLLRNDYYHGPAYPSYLLYNPDSITQLVYVDVGSGSHDIYDAASKQVIASSATGNTSFSIQPNSAVVAVVIPAGVAPTYEYDKMLVNGVVVDYHSNNVVSNYPPRIKSLAAANATIILGDTVNVYCTATDIDGDSLVYSWNSPNGKILGTGATISWVAPDTAGTCTIGCVVSDRHGLNDTASITLNAVKVINHPPVINGINGNPRIVNIGSSLRLTCHAMDLDSNSLSYNWTAPAGSLTGNDSVVTWNAPSTAGYYYVKCSVNDGQGGTAVDSLGILVQDFSKSQTGNLIAYFPFDNGEANDASGNGNNGVNNYATADTDRFGNPEGALSFNGVNSYVELTNDAMLNFQNAITVSYWMKIAQIFTREEYPLSHNKWNRWKVSISNDHLRWSIGTTVAVHDLDSETPMSADSLYFVTVVFDGAAMEIFLNGNLDAYAPWSGQLNTTSINLMIGAVYPGDNTASFDGTLDDIRIFDYAISFNDLLNLYATGVKNKDDYQPPKSFALYQNFPNPFNPTTKIKYDLSADSKVSLMVYDILGREVKTLVDRRQSPGEYEVDFNAKGLASGVYFYRLMTEKFSECRSMIVIK